MSSAGLDPTPMEELLERMERIPTWLEVTTAGNKVPLLQCWPHPRMPALGAWHDQYARIAGTTPISWARSTRADVELEIERCQRMNAKLFVCISPPIPPADGCLRDTIRRVEARWRWFDRIVNGQVEYDSGSIDLESNRYARDYPRSADEMMRDREVHEYNCAVYDIARGFMGSNASISRFGHMHVVDWGKISAAQYLWSQPLDPVDRGACFSVYEPTDIPGGLRTIRQNIEHARRFHFNEISMWITLGATYARWQCPGLAAFPQISGSWVCGAPYDPNFSFMWGRYLGHPWYRTEAHGELHRGGDYPPFNKIWAVGIWPGLFHPATLRTGPVHLVAFLEGLLNFSIGFDTRHQELQVQLWKQQVMGAVEGGWGAVPEDWEVEPIVMPPDMLEEECPPLLIP